MKFKYLPFIISIIFVPFLYNACTPSSSGSGPANTQQGTGVPDFTKLKPSCFTQVNPSAPILPLGSQFANSLWNDPHVLKVGNEFVMYASADTLTKVDDGFGNLINAFTGNIKIYRMISSNGKDWSLSPSTAVFERPVSGWDQGSVETPAVIFFKGLYYMFYTGYPDQKEATSYNIGYATSPDGISWTRQAPRLMPNGPVSPATCNFVTSVCDFMQYVVGEPAPVVFNDKIYLYFTAQGVAIHTLSPFVFSQENSIGMISSEDGLNWGTPQRVLTPDYSIYPFDSWRGYSTPNAVVLNKQLHLFYDVVYGSMNEPNVFSQRKIHHAYSEDGINNWVQDRESIFDRSQITWADVSINGPTVFLDGTNLYMWFGGLGNYYEGMPNSEVPNMNFGIGMAVCPL